MNYGGIDFTLVWLAIILFGLAMYVIMDGFDLGIGILFPFFKHKEDKDVMMNTVAPVWDGNETWMVLGGAALMGVFPVAYSVILSALYLPLIFMLLALTFRGVAFEFRFKADESHTKYWDASFFFGSLIATFFQGVVLGAIIEGMPVVDRQFAGSSFDWVAPFPLFSGLGLVVAYALLGATWLLIKTEGALEAQIRRYSYVLTALFLLTILIISIWTPLAHDTIASRWFSAPNFYFLMPIPFIVALVGMLLLYTIKIRHSHYPFFMVLILMLLGFVGLLISLWPNIIPYDVTFWEAAAPIESQVFMLIGTLLILPVILMYTGWSYYVFRGKVRPGEGGYH